jgi:hypothetical protein
MENARKMGDYIFGRINDWPSRFKVVGDVRGKGLMIGVEFGTPTSFKLKASWSMLEAASKGLFCQLIAIPLFKQHKILTQVAGHGSHTIKLLPPLIIAPILTWMALGRTEIGCLWRDRFKLSIPFVGELQRKIALSRFAHHLSILNSAGIEALSALRIVEGLVGNLGSVVDVVTLFVMADGVTQLVEALFWGFR